MANNSEIFVLSGNNQVRVAINDSLNLIVINQDVKQAFLNAIVSVVSKYANEVVKSIVIEFGATKNTIEFDPFRTNATLRLSDTVVRAFAESIISVEQSNYSPEMKQELINRLSDRLRKEMSNLEINGENAKLNKTETIVLNDISSIDIPALTPEYLADTITPYINAIIDLQHLIDEIKGRKPNNVNVKDIKRNSPISVSLDGASEAIQIIKETVVPWRRKHAETMAYLTEQEKLVEIESKKAEVLEKRAIANKEREQASKLRLENEKLQIELQQVKLKLAIEMLDHVSKNLSHAEREIFTKRLLVILDTLALGRLDMVSNK